MASGECTVRNPRLIQARALDLHEIIARRWSNLSPRRKMASRVGKFDIDL